MPITLDLTSIVLGAFALLGGGGALTAFLFYKQERARRMADTRKTDADADKTRADAEETNAKALKVTTDTYSENVTAMSRVVKQVREDYDRMSIESTAHRSRIGVLECRVDKLVDENKTLHATIGGMQGTIDGLRLLVGKLWKIILEGGLAKDEKLIAEVSAALLAKSDSDQPAIVSEGGPNGTNQC
jgi:hypothetical protein